MSHRVEHLTAAERVALGCAYVLLAGKDGLISDLARQHGVSRQLATRGPRARPRAGGAGAGAGAAAAGPTGGRGGAGGGAASSGAGGAGTPPGGARLGAGDQHLPGGAVGSGAECRLGPRGAERGGAAGARCGLPRTAVPLVAAHRNHRCFERGRWAGHTPLELAGLPSPDWLDAPGYGPPPPRAAQHPALNFAPEAPQTATTFAA